MPSELLSIYARSIYEVALDARWRDCSESGLLAGLLDCIDAWPQAPEEARFAVLSACNPLSGPLAGRANRARHQSLCASLRAAGLPHWPARGRAADSSWIEASVMLWAPLPWIDAAARRWEQHAVWLPGAPPTLRLYAEPPPGLPAVMAKVRLEWVGCGPPSPVDPH